MSYLTDDCIGFPCAYLMADDLSTVQFSNYWFWQCLNQRAFSWLNELYCLFKQLRGADFYLSGGYLCISVSVRWMALPFMRPFEPHGWHRFCYTTLISILFKDVKANRLNNSYLKNWIKHAWTNLAQMLHSKLLYQVQWQK